MSRSIQRIRGLVLGAGVAGALGFGASQALAGPAAAPGATQTCVAAVCAGQCLLRGYDRSVCRDGVCICYRLEE